MATNGYNCSLAGPMALFQDPEHLPGAKKPGSPPKSMLTRATRFEALYGITAS